MLKTSVRARPLLMTGGFSDFPDLHDWAGSQKLGLGLSV